MDNDSTPTSAYNEGMFQIQRLHFMWVQANNQSRQGNFTGWRWTLDRIWCELIRDVIKKTNKNFTPQDMDMILAENPWFIKYRTLDHDINVAEQALHLSPRNKIGQRSLYLAIMNLEIFLRNMQEVVGKGGKTRDDDDGEF